MWKNRLGMSIDHNYVIPTKEVVHLLKKTGFAAISPVWNPDADMAGIVETAREIGLFVQSLHGPYRKCTGFWSNDEVLIKEAMDEVMPALECCRDLSIPVMVIHQWIGFDYVFGETKYGFKNYEKLVRKAEEYGVKIAFENTEGIEYLRALMAHFSGNKNVGFCFDSGHELAYNAREDILGEFADRMIMMHLNDNMGISDPNGKTRSWDDLHLLPFDGILDWEKAMRRLKKANELPYLNFELKLKSKKDRHENDKYREMLLEDYFREAYKRACILAEMFEKK